VEPLPTLQGPLRKGCQIPTVSSAFWLSLSQLTILGYSIVEFMAHTAKNKHKLLARVRRIRGQVDAIERALDSDEECGGVLQLMAACRGALNGLMAEVMEGHVRFHVLSPDNRKNSPQVEAAEELIDIVRAYLK
jgi:FrmR/RcnR family transcriptional regulator, repressor of frmRAB operon